MRPPLDPPLERSNSTVSQNAVICFIKLVLVAVKLYANYLVRKLAKL